MRAPLETILSQKNGTFLSRRETTFFLEEVHLLVTVAEVWLTHNRGKCGRETGYCQNTWRTRYILPLIARVVDLFVSAGILVLQNCLYCLMLLVTRSTRGHCVCQCFPSEISNFE